MDLLSRLFAVNDITDNQYSENFGFVFLEGQRPLVKIVDFSVKREREFVIEDGNFYGFLYGRENFHYPENVRSIASYIIADKRSQILRAKMGLQVMQDIYKQKNALKIAFDFVIEHLSHEIFLKDRIDLSNRLERYQAFVLSNFEYFMKCFHERELS